MKIAKYAWLVGIALSVNVANAASLPQGHWVGTGAGTSTSGEHFTSQDEIWIQGNTMTEQTQGEGNPPMRWSCDLNPLDGDNVEWVCAASPDVNGYGKCRNNRCDLKFDNGEQLLFRTMVFSGSNLVIHEWGKITNGPKFDYTLKLKRQ